MVLKLKMLLFRENKLNKLRNKKINFILCAVMGFNRRNTWNLFKVKIKVSIRMSQRQASFNAQRN